MAGWYVNIYKACSLHIQGKVTEKWLIYHIYSFKYAIVETRTHDISSDKWYITTNMRTRSVVNHFTPDDGDSKIPETMANCPP